MLTVLTAWRVGKLSDLSSNCAGCMHQLSDSTVVCTHGRTLLSFAHDRTLLLFAHMTEFYCCFCTRQNSTVVSTHGRILLLFAHMAEFYCCFHTWQNSTVSSTWQNSAGVCTQGRPCLCLQVVSTSPKCV